MQVNVNRVWLTISSIVLAFAFVFGNSIRNVFESVVFLFVVHPFDVGDALLVVDPGDSSAGPQYYKVRCSHLPTYSVGGHACVSWIGASHRY